MPRGVILWTLQRRSFILLAMTKRLISAALALGLVASPTAAFACDLDGLPGFHRYNPFAQVPGFPGLAPRAGIVRPDPEPQKFVKVKPETSVDKKAAKPTEDAKKAVPSAKPLPIREWEREWGNSSSSPEGLTTDI